MAVYEFSKHIDELVAWSARFEASDRANVPADEERRALRASSFPLAFFFSNLVLLDDNADSLWPCCFLVYSQA